MSFVKVAIVSDVPEGTKKKFEVGGTTILIVKYEGNYYAMSNKCPHMGGSLVDGNLDGKIIVCPKHGSKFDVTTGKNVGNAKLGFIKINVKEPDHSGKNENRQSKH